MALARSVFRQLACCNSDHASIVDTVDAVSSLSVAGKRERRWSHHRVDLQRGWSAYADDPVLAGLPSLAALAEANGTRPGRLHTHAADGIIHIESPVHRTFTLGDFFDVWGQSLGPDQVGPATGPVVAIYNGQLYEVNPRDIPLNAHAQIQLEIGKPLVAPVTITFPTGL